MKRLLRLYNLELSLGLFLVALALASFLPFYLIGASTFFSSHTIAKALILFSLFVFMFFNFKSAQKIISENKIIFMLLLLYFLGQSLSVVNAPDIPLFFKTYHNSIIFVAIFAISFFLLRNIKLMRIILPFCLYLSVSLIVFELFLRTFWDYLLPYFGLVVQREVVDAYLFNISQGKLSLAQGNERFIPFLLIPLLLKNKINAAFRLLITLTLLISLGLSFLSNFRIRSLLVFFTLFAFLPFIKSYYQSIKSYKPILTVAVATLVIGVIGLLAIQLSNVFYSFNVLDRFLIQSENADLGPINTRISQMGNSLEVFKAYPIFGIGLGNYSYIFNEDVSPSPYIKNYQRSFAQLSSSRPHNILVQLLGETGIVGLGTFIALLIFFMRQDIKILKGGIEIKSFAFIVSSWSVILYSMFNPTDTIFTFAWFWFCRGVIQTTPS